MPFFSQAIAASPSIALSGIITDNLLVHLDAGNSTSYPGTGTDWTDLISSSDATLENGVTYNSGNGGHFVFDGSNDYVDARIFTVPAKITVSVWCSIDTTGSKQQLFTSDESSVPIRNWQFRVEDSGAVGAIVFHTSGTNNVHLITTSTLSTNTWTQVSMTVDGTDLKIYFNGVEQATTSFPYDILGNGSAGDGLIGVRHSGDRKDYLDGKIAVALIYSDALSSTELTNNYNVLSSRF